MKRFLEISKAPGSRDRRQPTKLQFQEPEATCNLSVIERIPATKKSRIHSLLLQLLVPKEGKCRSREHSQFLDNSRWRSRSGLSSVQSLCLPAILQSSLALPPDILLLPERPHLPLAPRTSAPRDSRRSKWEEGKANASRGTVEPTN